MTICRGHMNISLKETCRITELISLRLCHVLSSEGPGEFPSAIDAHWPHKDITSSGGCFPDNLEAFYVHCRNKVLAVMHLFYQCLICLCADTLLIGDSQLLKSQHGQSNFGHFSLLQAKGRQVCSTRKNLQQCQFPATQGSRVSAVASHQHHCINICTWLIEMEIAIHHSIRELKLS